MRKPASIWPPGSCFASGGKRGCSKVLPRKKQPSSAERCLGTSSHPGAALGKVKGNELGKKKKNQKYSQQIRRLGGCRGPERGEYASIIIKLGKEVGSGEHRAWYISRATWSGKMELEG